MNKRRGVIVSHPTGNAFARALIASLHEADLLQRFYTAIAITGTPFYLQFMPQLLREEFSRRTYCLPSTLVTQSPAREIARNIGGKLGLAKMICHESGWASVDSVYRALDRKLANALEYENPSIVYCYEDGALHTFQKAKELGIRRAYDLPIAYWKTVRRLLQEEALRHPDWEPTLISTRDSEDKLNRKDAELELAESIVCPSRFVLESLPVEHRRRAFVSEFGSPVAAEYHRAENRAAVGKLRFLFAGTMSQRKGLADVLQAFKTLCRQDVELVIIGSALMTHEFYRKQYGEFIYEPTRPHAAVLELMKSCDVLLLPSIVEGRALVQQEAMSCGLPLIVTANAGGEDLIVEGRTGFLVPIRSPEAIAEKISWFADNRHLLPEMRECAMNKARERTWEAYGAKIASALRQLAENPLATGK